MPKTLAIKLSDELHAQAAAVASLEGISLTELIRTSIEGYLDTKRDSGELQQRAQAVLDDIERDAKARQAAIATLFGTTERTGEAKPAAARKTPKQSE